MCGVSDMANTTGRRRIGALIQVKLTRGASLFGSYIKVWTLDGLKYRSLLS